MQRSLLGSTHTSRSKQKHFFQVLRHRAKSFVFTNYDLNTLVPRTGCVSDAIILEELASRLRLTSSGRHLFCEFAHRARTHRQNIDSTSTAYRQHIDSILYFPRYFAFRLGAAAAQKNEYFELIYVLKTRGGHRCWPSPSPQRFARDCGKTSMLSICCRYAVDMLSICFRCAVGKS